MIQVKVKCKEKLYMWRIYVSMHMNNKWGKCICVLPFYEQTMYNSFNDLYLKISETKVFWHFWPLIKI